MKAQWSWVWDNECNWLACHCAGWWWCNSYLPNTDWAAHCTGLPPHILPGAGLVLRTLSLTSSLSALAVESKYLIFVNIITSSRRQYRRERERDEYNVEEREKYPARVLSALLLSRRQVLKSLGTCRLRGRPVCHTNCTDWFDTNIYFSLLMLDLGFLIKHNLTELTDKVYINIVNCKFGF